MPWIDVHGDYVAWVKSQRRPPGDIVAFKAFLERERPEWTRRKVEVAGLVWVGLSVRWAEGASPMRKGSVPRQGLVT